MTRTAATTAFLFVFSVLAVSIFSHSTEALAAPVLTSAAPSSVLTTGGDTVTLSGTGFESDSKILLNGVAVPSTVYISDSVMTFTAPAQPFARSMPLVVENALGQQSSAVTFIYSDPALSVISISPAAGSSAGGQAITINGSNFTKGQRKISQVAMGDNFTCGLYEFKAFCWGLNGSGQLGEAGPGTSVEPLAVNTTGVLAGKTIKMIAAGGNHACAIASDDLVYCWGSGSEGQLGNGSNANSSVPVAVSRAGVLSGKTILSVTAGSNHTCAIASDGFAYCWGLNTNGQLGNNNTTTTNIPVAVLRTSGSLSGVTVKSLSAGGSQTCAVTSLDTAACWGQNTDGQLGNNSITQRSFPVDVNTSGVLAGLTIKSISTGKYHTCAIASNDKAYCWGLNTNSGLGNGNTTRSLIPVAVNTNGELLNKNLKTITVGQYFTCVIASDNNAYCWGYGGNGNLGNGSNSTTNTSVVPVTTSGALAGKTLKYITTASINVYATCVIASDDQLYCFGANANKQLGFDAPGNTTVPTLSRGAIVSDMLITIGGVVATNITQVSSTVITATTPVQTAGFKDVTATRYDGQTSTLANGYRYTSGPGDITLSPSSGPAVGGDAVTISGSNFDANTKLKVDDIYLSTFTLVNDSTITFTTPSQSYGRNVEVVVEDTYGVQSPSVFFTYTDPPMTITSVSPTGGSVAGGGTISVTGTNFSPGVKDISQISSGSAFSCGIYNDDAYCWGFSGKLGDGKNTESRVPVPVVKTGVLAGKTIKQISAGQSGACAIASDDLAYCWGQGNNGQTGDGGNTANLAPDAVSRAGVLSGLTIKSISSGDNHTCAIASDDLLYCWGYNATGQLGNSSTTQSLVPVAVSRGGALAGKTIKSVSSSANNTCAIASDDQVYCWGYNAGSQLGNGSTTQALAPVAVSTLGVLAGKTIKQMSSGGGTTCVVASDENIYCWGDNNVGQYGNNSVTASTTPTATLMTGALNSKTIKQISVGSNFVCVVASDSKVYCWGGNSSGQLGDGGISQSTVPKAVLTNGVLANKSIRSVSANFNQACVVTTSNKAYCWGYNAYGQLGNNASVQSQTSPVAVNPVQARPLTLTIGGTAATNVQSSSLTSITATIPAHQAGVTDVVAGRYDNTTATASNAYTYVTSPGITLVSPDSGLIAGGDTVTITGTGFSEGVKVKFAGSYIASPTRVSDTTITFVTPATAKPGAVDVAVEDTYGQVSTVANGFTYKLSDPTLASISPSAGPMGGGTAVTITGSGFVNNPDGATWYQVRIGGVLATNVAYVNSTTLTATAPVGTIGIKDVTVSSIHTNIVTLANSYTYNAQSYVFTNTALNLSKDEPGTLTITARNASNSPVTSPTPMTVSLASSSTGGSFARNLSEDIATRWTYTSVVIPAGQSSVTVFYKDILSGTPTITGTVVGSAPFTQTATISSPFRFVVSGVSDPIKSGVASSVTIRVTDKNGNQRNDYTGTIVFSSNDPAASVPANYTMKASDYGIKTFTNGVTMGSVGDYCVTAADSVDGAVARGQQCSITVQAPNTGTISKLAIITPEQNITAGKFSSPITIQTQDVSGISIPVAADKQIYLYSPSSTGEFSNDGTNWSGTMPVTTTIKAGSSSVNVYFRDSTAHTTTIKAMDNPGEATGGDFGWLNANQSITTGLSPPTKMRITGLQAMVSGQKSNYLVELLDDAGNLVSADSDITIRVGSDTPTSLFYFPATASSGVSGPTEFTIPSGLTNATIAFSDTTISTSTDFTTLTFTDGRPMTETVRLQDAMKDVQIVAALPAKIAVNSILTTMEAGDSTAVDVQLLDSANQAAPAIETTTINLSSSTPTGQFSLTQTPFTPVTSVTITQGQSLKRVYFRDTVTGTSTLSASRSGFAATPDQVEITSSDTASFGITPTTSSTPIDTSSGAFTVTSYDVFGNVVVQNSNLSVYPYSNQTTTRFAATATGPWNLTSATILAGQSSAQFYAKDTAFYGGPIQITASDKAALDNPDIDIANATANLTIASQAVASIVITTSQQTIVAGTVSNKIDIELRKTDGSPALQNGATNVNILVADGKFIATNNSQASAINSVAIAQGTATASFYYYGEKASTQTISATVAGSSTTTTQPLIVQAAAPSKVIFQSPTAAVTPNTPTAAIHAIVRDTFNNNATYNTAQTMTLSSSCASGSFSVSSSNWQSVNTINVPANSSDIPFYYKDTTPGTCTITATIAGVTAAIQQVTITSYAVDTIVFTTAAHTIKAGDKTGVITVQLRKADGTPAVQDGTTQLQLNAQNGQFYLNANDTATISTLTVADGQSTASFYYSGTVAGSQTISVNMAGLATPATQQVTVTPEAATRLAYTTQPQTFGEGEPSGVIHVSIKDTYGNNSALTSNKTLTLTSSCQTGTFSEDSTNWQPVASIELASGSVDATFYYKAMIQGSCTITAETNGITSASQLMTITDSNFPVRVGLVVPSETLTKGETRSLSINLLDQNGDISAAKVRTVVTMSTSSDGTFGTTSVVFDPGVSTSTVTYRNNVAGQVTIYARDQAGAADTLGSLIDTSAMLNYVDGAPASVKIVAAASTAQVGEPTTLTVTLLNAYSVPVSAANNTVITLSSNRTSGSFFDANGNATNQITIPATQQQATASYRQTQTGAGTVTAQSAGLTSSTAVITVISQDAIAEIRFLNAPPTIDVGETETYRVGLYDEFGNIAITTNPLTLYAFSNVTGEVSNGGQFVIGAGTSNGIFTYKQNTVGPFTMTVDDSPIGTAGAVNAISQNGQVIAGNPKTFRITPSSTTLERGGVTDAIKVELLNANNELTAATGSGQSVTIGQVNGNGKYSISKNGTFTNQIQVIIPSGQSSIEYYYRNDTSSPGVQTYPVTSSFQAVLQTKTGSVTLRYGEPTQLVYITQPLTIEARSPSPVLTIQQQNQYGMAVPVATDKTIYLTSNAPSGRFGSSKVDWDVTSVVILSGASTANFYYQDSTDGQRTITASDTLPLNPDILLVNATQLLNVTPSSNNPRIVNNFLVTNISDPQAQGTQSSLVLIARDADGYIVESYDGTVSFSSNDSDAQLPETYTFIPGIDKGVHVFTNQVAFSSEGEKVVTVTDANGITGEQTDITVGEGNTNPITALVITQPESPVTIAPNAVSPNITVELRDSAGISTNAPAGGLAIRVTSTTSTGQFATSAGGPWLNSLVITIPENIGYANLYYRDSAVGNATITASDWNGSVDSLAIDNATLDVVVHRTYVDGVRTIQTLNALGEYEMSTQLFARNSDGAITGKVANNFTSRDLVNNQLVSVDWRTQWRQGVNLLKSDAASDVSSFAVNVDPIQTTAGASDFYAVAETTETTFADTFSVVSKQLQTMVSAWKTAITTPKYALNNESIETTVSFRNGNTLTSPSTASIFLLPADATNISAAVRVDGFASPNSTLQYSIPAGIATLGGSYKLLAVTYDTNGNTTSQVVSNPFTVLATAPIDEVPPVIPTLPITPTNNTPLTQSPGDTAAPVAPVEPVTPPVEPTEPVSPPTTPATTNPTATEGVNNTAITAGIVATYAATIFVGVFLVRESYKEWARIRRIRSVLKREQQLAADKNTFLSLASHYLRTPITILDAAASMVPTSATLTTVAASLRNKANVLLENGAASSLSEIVSPDIEKVTRSAFKSVYFWLPIILSIALTIAVTVLFNVAASGADLNSGLVYTGIIVTALALIIGFGARTVFINKEVTNAKRVMELHRAQLFNAKSNFIMAMQTDLTNEIAQLRITLSSPSIIPDNVKATIQDATGRLEQLVSKLTLVAQINGMAPVVESFTPKELVQASVERLQTTIADKKLAIVEQYDENALVSQDERLLKYVTGTVLDNAVMFSQPGSIIDIDTSKHGKTTQVSITNEDSSFGSVEKLKAMFEPFNHATHEDDLTVEGMGLSLYLDKLIMNHLGGDITASNSVLHRSASINITFPSVK